MPYNSLETELICRVCYLEGCMEGLQYSEASKLVKQAMERYKERFGQTIMEADSPPATCHVPAPEQ